MQDEIELTDLETKSYANSASELVATIDALPPVDTGKGAWLFLVSATVIEIFVWGVPFSIGVLMEYYLTVMFPEGTPDRSLVTLAATLQTGLMYCSGVCFNPLLARYPQHRSKLQFLGLFGSVTSIIGAAFATKPIHLIFTIGLIYPCSGILYFPCATLLFEWFSARRGLAAGIMYGGTGFGGTIFPFIIGSLLSNFGYKTTMISLGITFGVACSIALISIKPRIPPLSTRNALAPRRKTDWSFLKRSPFWAFAGAIGFTSLGNFLPSVYIPTFAIDLGLSRNDGTLLIALMNAASIPGLVVLGYLSDRWPLRLVISISSLGSAISCLLFWGFAKNIQLLTVFVIVFGALALSFSAVWTKLIMVAAGDDPTLPGIILSFFAFARGIGNITSGPISSSLLSYAPFEGAAGAYGVKNYGPLLIYTGVTMILGTIAGVSYKDPKKRAV